MKTLDIQYRQAQSVNIDLGMLDIAAIYGPRIKGNYPSTGSGRTVARRQFIPIGDGNNRRTLDKK
jgi:hypothetical protein